MRDSTEPKPTTKTSIRSMPEWLVKQLECGNRFHRLVATFYAHESSGFKSEKVLFKDSGKRGRVDLVIQKDGDIDYIVIIETKWTDWDRLARRGTVDRNLVRHINQVWSYLDGWIRFERNGTSAEVQLQDVERTTALVYPWRPRTAGLSSRIEDALGEWGISVVWFDEAPPENSPAYTSWEALKRGEFGDTGVLKRPSKADP